MLALSLERLITSVIGTEVNHVKVISINTFIDSIVSEKHQWQDAILLSAVWSKCLVVVTAAWLQ